MSEWVGGWLWVRVKSEGFNTEGEGRGLRVRAEAEDEGRGLRVRAEAEGEWHAATAARAWLDSTCC